MLILSADVLLAQEKPDRFEGDSLSMSQSADRWFAEDKYSHFTISGVLMAGQTFVYIERGGMRESHAVLASAAGTAVIGLAKEAYDAISRRGRASWRDVVADLAGVALVAFFVLE